MKTFRRSIAMGMAFLLAISAASASAQAPARRGPNIVLIYADDLGWGDVGFNGRKEWSTPSLDRLGAQGTIFRRFYTAAVVCAPSRAAMLTGRATIHDGVSRNDDDLPSREVTMAEALKALGYSTALFGKWHRGSPRGGVAPGHPMDQGFDEFFGFTDAKHAWEQFPDELYEGRLLKARLGLRQRPVHGPGGRLPQEASRRRPFFLYLPYIATHFNIEAPPDEVELHKGKFPEVDPSKPLNATYAAMVTRLDRNVGRVLAAIDDLKLADDTIVIFTSDHGATFESGNQGTSNALDSNHPFRGQKRTLWEGGIRVPGVVRWPGHVPSRPSISDEVIVMTDLFPTLLAAVGASKPTPPGRSTASTSSPPGSAPAHVPDRTLFWEWRSEGSNQIAAMRGNYKLVGVNNGPPELFDVEADPGERRNIIAEHGELAARLKAELKAWLATETRD